MHTVKRDFKVRLFLNLFFFTNKLMSKLRIFKYRFMGARIGKNVALGSIYCPFPELLTIGDSCIIEDNVRFRSGGAWLSAPIYIGNGTFIGHGTQINIGSPFAIGENCLIAPGCIFSDAQHIFLDKKQPIATQGSKYCSIVIKNDVWIGSGAIVLGGVCIEDGCVVGAGALVNKSTSQFEVWAGVPIKKIRNR